MGVAHGYQTLVDDTSVVYLITGEFVPEAARTLLWRDPVLGITWPLEVSSISDSDEAGQPWPVTF
jgi:dTDP-4-dehydrorhamnose 3,5-epimerase